MNKKTLIICIAALSVLLLLVVGAVAVLYSGNRNGQSEMSDDIHRQASLSRPVLNAVPSDAAMVMYSSSFKEGISVLRDSTYIIGNLFSGTGRSTFTSFVKKIAVMLDDGALNSARNSEMTLSMHYSGDLVPLLILRLGKMPEDSLSGVGRLIAEAPLESIYTSVTDMSEAKDSPLKKSVVVAFSPSDNLVNSCKRHVLENISILDDDIFAGLSNSLTGNVVMMLNNNYSSKLTASFISAENRRKAASFIGNFSRWTGCTLNEMNPESLYLIGKARTYDSPAYFYNIFRNMRPEQPLYSSVLPEGTRFAVAVQISDIDSYIQSYRKYRDAIGQINKYKASISDQSAKSGISPDKWALSLDIKEVCKAYVPAGNDYSPILLLRPGKTDVSQIFRNQGYRSMKDYKGEIVPTSVNAFAGAVFGGVFDISDTSMIYHEGWIIIGGEEAVSGFSDTKRRTLSDYMKDSGLGSSLSANTSAQVYYSPSSDPVSFSEYLAKGLSASVKYLLDGIGSCPVVVSVVPGNEPVMEFSLSRLQKSEYAGPAPSLIRDTLITVPAGPFKVRNCGTGRTNLFSQSNNHIVLKEEDGKGIWGVPFSSPVCGMVAQIDYFANGKIQFLFASGSKLYLIDRLGRFVKPFPVDLGKDVLLGPAAYDFSGAHGYTVMVLHTDNTVGMYNLHGKVPDTWKGIQAPEKIKSMPELLVSKGKRYWAVRTSARTMLFGENGGSPIINPEGNKMIRPDTQIKINDNNTVSVICYDGKERNFKF